MSKLAVFGGEPVRKTPFVSIPMVDEDEMNLVVEAVKNLDFSKHSGPYFADIQEILATKSIDALKYPMGGYHFLGGRNIRQFEADFSKHFGVDYSISVNSATSGLSVALAACGVSVGDEVITTPMTFTATSSSILLFNSIPVFVDIDPNTFCIDADKIEAAITERTKAILLVHLYGNACNMDKIMAIARKHNLRVIEDCAQSIGTKYKGQYTGTIGDLGVFSFQQTKNIMTGEGGMIITNNPEYAKKCRLIRNHGEGAMLYDQSETDLENIIGCNFRMTELSACLGIAQLRKLTYLNNLRIQNAHKLLTGLRTYTFLEPMKIEEGCEWIPHIIGLKYSEELAGMPRPVFIEALKAEGLSLTTGYLRLNYENPTFLHKIAYGKKGYPFVSNDYESTVQYYKGMCPVSEELREKDILCFYQIGYPTTEKDIDDLLLCIEKVIAHKDELLEKQGELINRYNRSLGGLLR